MTETLGTARDAEEALDHYLTGGYNGERAEEIGRGEDRVAYLVNGVVYKVGRRATANPYDHETLTAARAAGMPWAPPTALYWITDRYAWSGLRWPVLAMPYLPDDGSDADPELVAEMHAQTGGGVDRIGGNYVVRDGQPIVLDGCTVTVGAWV